MESVEKLRTLAVRAYAGISFEPEQRGERLIKECSEELAGILGGIPEEHRPQVEGSYIRLLSAWLNAKSRVMSTMITGSGNFPVAQQEKYRRWEQNHLDRFCEYKGAIVERLQKRAARKAYTVEGEIEELLRDIERIKAERATVMACNSILRSIMPVEEKRAAIAALGVDPDKVHFLGNLTNSLNRLKSREARVAKLRKQIAARDVEQPSAEVGGVRVVENAALNRLQLFFPDKPNDAQRSILKRSGYRWSPSNGCWQAYMSAKCRVSEVLDKVNAAV